MKSPDCRHWQEEEVPIKDHANDTSWNRKVGKFEVVPRHYGIEERIVTPWAVEHKRSNANRDVKSSKDDGSNPDADANITANVEEEVVLYQQRHFDESQCRCSHDDGDIALLFAVSRAGDDARNQHT